MNTALHNNHPFIALAIPSTIATAYFVFCLFSIELPPIIDVIPGLPRFEIFTAYPSLFIWRIVQIIKAHQTRPMIAFLLLLAALESAGLFVIVFFISIIALVGGPINPG